MSLLSEARALLSRPITPPPAPPPAPARGKVAQIEPPPPPVTREELWATLQRFVEERAEARAIIDGAAARREALLEQESEEADRQIDELDRQIERASRLIERLDLVEPDLMGRYNELAYKDHVDRWVELRDQFLAAGDEMIRAFDAAREVHDSVWLPARAALLAEFGSAGSLFAEPPTPHPGMVQQFADRLHSMRQLIPMRTQQPILPSLEYQIEHAGNPEVPNPNMGAWGAFAELGLRDAVTVRFVGNVRDANGHPRGRGETVALPGPEAVAEIQRGRAELVKGQYP
jgi:hypothetical protein